MNPRRTIPILLLVLVLAAPVCAQPLLNEVLYDGASVDVGMFTEIYGPVGFDLTGYMLVGCNGADGLAYRNVPLLGVIGSDGLYVVAQDNSVPNADQIDLGVDWQNGAPDSVLLLDPQGEVVDALRYGAGTDMGCGGEGAAAPDVNPGSSLIRCPDGQDSGDNGSDFLATVTPTPGQLNLESPDCGPIQTTELRWSTLKACY